MVILKCFLRFPVFLIHLYLTNQLEPVLAIVINGTAGVQLETVILLNQKSRITITVTCGYTLHTLNLGRP